MSPVSTPRLVILRASPILAALLLTALFMLLSTVPATAHDDLSGSSPEEGAVVDQLPEALQLTFTDVPSPIGSEILVLDEAGENWAEGPVAITDRVANQPLRPGGPAGEYTVVWRVVSLDAHPIEGTFAFTAGGGVAGVSGAEGPASGGAEGPASGEATPGTSAGTTEAIDSPVSGDVEPDPASVNEFPWSIVIMIAVLAVLAVVLAVTARKRLGQSNDAA